MFGDVKYKNKQRRFGQEQAAALGSVFHPEDGGDTAVRTGSSPASRE
jgi:hypothetical protein